MNKNTSTSDSLENKLVQLESSFKQSTSDLNKKILGLQSKLKRSEEHLNEILRDNTAEIERLNKEMNFKVQKSEILNKVKEMTDD